MLIDPSNDTPDDPAVVMDDDGIQRVDWANVRNDTLRELYFEVGHYPVIRKAAASEAAMRIGTGAMRASEAAGIDLDDANLDIDS